MPAVALGCLAMAIGSVGYALSWKWGWFTLPLVLAIGPLAGYGIADRRRSRRSSSGPVEHVP